MKMHYLDLSTSHLTQDTMEMLAKLTQPGEFHSGWPAMTIASYPEGVFVTVPGDYEPEQWDALPKDLQGVFEYAQIEHAMLIRFDSDGDEEEGLKTYDWDSQEEMGRRLAKTVVGKRFVDAAALCNSLGFTLRATHVNNVAAILIADIRMDRISAKVVHDRVIEAQVG